MNNYKKILFLAVLVIFSVSFTGCKKKNRAVDARQTKVYQDMQLAQKEGKNALLFFLNPNGRPCQNQNAILEEIKGQVNQKINYVYVSSLDPVNNTFYYQYGVRSLPTIMILDKMGKIAVRFSPGIIDKNALLENINKL